MPTWMDLVCSLEPPPLESEESESKPKGVCWPWPLQRLRQLLTKIQLDPIQEPKPPSAKVPFAANATSVLGLARVFGWIRSQPPSPIEPIAE